MTSRHVPRSSPVVHLSPWTRRYRWLCWCGAVGAVHYGTITDAERDHEAHAQSEHSATYDGPENCDDCREPATEIIHLENDGLYLCDFHLSQGGWWHLFRMVRIGRDWPAEPTEDDVYENDRRALETK